NPPQSTFKSAAPASGVMKNPGSSSRKTSVPAAPPMPGPNPPSPASSSAKANLMAQTPPPGFRTPQIEMPPVTPPEKPKPLPPEVVSLITWTMLVIVFLATLVTSLWFILPPDFLQKVLKWIGG